MSLSLKMIFGSVDVDDASDDAVDACDDADDAYDDGEEGRFCVSARGADIQDMPCTGIRVRTQLHFILCQIFRYIHILSDFPDIFYITPYNLIGISIVSSSAVMQKAMCKILANGKRTFA